MVPSSFRPVSLDLPHILSLDSFLVWVEVPAESFWSGGRGKERVSSLAVSIPPPP